MMVAGGAGIALPNHDFAAGQGKISPVAGGEATHAIVAAAAADGKIDVNIGVRGEYFSQTPSIKNARLWPLVPLWTCSTLVGVNFRESVARALTLQKRIGHLAATSALHRAMLQALLSSRPA